CQHGYGTPPTV
nr:immunoglobulin light chain junction region [Macaca mulatta]MPO00878.1 immunoglobulin light chain junction region [Macaca mulatta]